MGEIRRVGQRVNVVGCRPRKSHSSLGGLTCEPRGTGRTSVLADIDETLDWWCTATPVTRNATHRNSHPAGNLLSLKLSLTAASAEIGGIDPEANGHQRKAERNDAEQRDHCELSVFRPCN